MTDLVGTTGAHWVSRYPVERVVPEQEMHQVASNCHPDRLPTSSRSYQGINRFGPCPVYSAMAKQAGPSDSSNWIPLSLVPLALMAVVRRSPVGVLLLGLLVGCDKKKPKLVEENPCAKVPVGVTREKTILKENIKFGGLPLPPLTQVVCKGPQVQFTSLGRTVKMGHFTLGSGTLVAWKNQKPKTAKTIDTKLGKDNLPNGSKIDWGPHPEKEITIKLPKNTTIQGLPCAAAVKIHIDQKTGKLTFLGTSKAYLGNTKELGKITIAANSFVKRDHEDQVSEFFLGKNKKVGKIEVPSGSKIFIDRRLSLISTTKKYPYTIDATLSKPVAIKIGKVSFIASEGSTVRFNEGLKIEFVEFATQTTVTIGNQKITFPKHTRITLGEAQGGLVSHAVLGGTFTIKTGDQSITYGQKSEITYGKDTIVSEAKFKGDSIIKIGNDFFKPKTNSKATFYDNGKLHTCVLGEDKIIQGQSKKKGDTLRFDKNGKLQR